MKKITFPFLLLLLLIPILVSAQQTKMSKQAPIIMDKPTTILEKNITPGNSPLLGSYVGVDTMTNALSYAETGITPLTFDPYSGVLALVHRGWGGHYAAGSGQIWYNLSTDYGVTWKRVPGGVNTANPTILGRYPNMTISNPTKGKQSATTGFFVWPELNPSAFGFMGYAADQPLGNGSPAAFLDQGGAYSTRMMATADDQSPEVLWMSASQLDAGLQLFKTADFATIETLNPPAWNDTVFRSNGNIGMGAYSYNGIQYVAAFGPYDSLLLPDPPDGGWLVGYSKSTDQGKTWSEFKMADFRKIPKLSNNTVLFDYKKGDAFISYQGNIGVDKNNHVHLIYSVTAGTADSTNSLVDVFERNDGTWDATVIFAGLDTAYSNGPGLGQVGPSSEIAFDTTHTVMAVQYINVAAKGKLNDIWFTYKGISDTVWAQPENLTKSSDSINCTSAHMAPYLYKSGVNQYTAFSGYCYSPSPLLPDYDGNTTAVIYASTHSFTYTTPVGVNDPVNTVNSFNLLQNYPNPFNPSTIISYSLSERNNVSLKVYDMLGREVANLVNESQNAGSHSISFNASKLASGLYIYTLRTGNNSMSKKMMLMK